MTKPKSKPHPLTGVKKDPKAVEKMKETKRLQREATERGEEPPKRKYTKRPKSFQTRTPDQIQRDASEALHCIDKAVSIIRREIQAGTRSLTEVTDYETYVYMAKRYLEGGLK